MLSRLEPQRIVVASTAPQVRYPDCYGIDMADLRNLIAFQAVMSLLYEDGRQGLVEEVYTRCQAKLDGEYFENEVRALYAPYRAEQISERIAKLLRPPDLQWKGELVLVFQSIETLREALPQHQGDWYFTGNYPTSGGNRVVHQAFVNYIQGLQGRGY
jgi:amidophosphoribosyltransferase